MVILSKLIYSTKAQQHHCDQNDIIRAVLIGFGDD
jgi:hypothetical protein